MHRFELTTCYRLADGASGVVRSDTLVTSESLQCVPQVWEINEADIQLADALYPVAQEAKRRGYYMPNAARSTAVVISVQTGDAVSRILAVWCHFRELVGEVCRKAGCSKRARPV
jgi:hypothetical protein